MLQLTDKAVKKVKELLVEENKDGYGLRVAVQGGGCSGFQYGLTWENEQAENDQVFEFGGLRVFVDAASNLYLDEVTIDLSGGSTSATFPNTGSDATVGTLTIVFTAN